VLALPTRQVSSAFVRTPRLVHHDGDPPNASAPQMRAAAASAAQFTPCHAHARAPERCAPSFSARLLTPPHTPRSARCHCPFATPPEEIDVFWSAPTTTGVCDKSEKIAREPPGGATRPPV